MEVVVPVIPKVDNIFVHTGNIVNWNRLKGTVSKSATSELTDCIETTIKGWLEVADRDALQYVHEVQCTNTKFSEKLNEDERNEMKLTVKIFASNQTNGMISDAIDKVMGELNVLYIETVILSVPDDQRTLENIQPLWSALEEQVSKQRVYSLGISDLAKVQLEELYTWATEKPCINQVNLTTCCVIPQELKDFAKQHDIQLLTHNDPTVILSAKELQQLIGSVLTSPMDCVLWQPSWVARYSVLIKCRGIIKSKGYIMRATRDIKHRPYKPSVPSATVPTDSA